MPVKWPWSKQPPSAPVPETTRERWNSGSAHEIFHWESWLRSKGNSPGPSFADRFDPNREIDPQYARFINPESKVLDVGAGPVSSLGTKLNGRPIDLTAIDPLAEKYNSVLDEEGLEPPVRTQFGEAEDIKFDDGTFDLVHCRNALDHSRNPIKGIQEMLRVAKPGGHVVMWHVINEGENEKYWGLHQWNFIERNGDFVIWNKEGEWNINRMLKGSRVEATTEEGRFLTVTIHKSSRN